MFLKLGWTLENMETPTVTGRTHMDRRNATWTDAQAQDIKARTLKL